MPQKSLRFIIHVIGWIAFLTIPFLLAPGSRLSLERADNPHTLLDLTSYGMMIIFFYLNFFFLLDKYYFKKKIGLYIFICILFSLLIVFLPRIVLNNQFKKHDMHERHEVIEKHEEAQFRAAGDSLSINMQREEHHDYDENNGWLTRLGGHHFFFDVRGNLFMFLLIILLSLLMKMKNRWQLAEQEKISSELSYLKAQINPHFLFNTLNSIYSLALEKSDYTPTAVVKLSGMMRYVITDASSDFVGLDKEINYIRDYVDLQKIRLGDTAEVNFQVVGEKAGKRISPLLFISFIENAFKYGVNPDKQSVINIKFQVEQNSIVMEVSNKKVDLFIQDEESSKVGVENTINRLKLIYPNKYTLTMDDGEKEYKVQLRIELV